MKKYAFWVVLMVATWGLLESFSYLGLRLLQEARGISYEPADRISAKQKKKVRKVVDGTAKYSMYSRKLGWSVKKDGFSGIYKANSAGIRSSREYSLEPPSAVLRISTFGDSFTHGDEVENEATWQSLLESWDDRLEVLNFGMKAFGMDQSYLRYLEDGVRYGSHIVFIGYMSSNIFRHVNTFRPYCFPETGFPMTKPRFMIREGVLALLPNPLQSPDEYRLLLSGARDVFGRIGAADYYYPRRYKRTFLDWSPTVRLSMALSHSRREKYAGGIVKEGEYDISSEAFRVTTMLFDEFYESVVRDGALPVILLFPDKDDVERYRKRGTRKYDPLLSYLGAKGYRYIDLLEAFHGNGRMYMTADLLERHYTPLGNRLVAEKVWSFLSENHPDSPGNQAGGLQTEE